jgi:hypothetical protein
VQTPIIFIKKSQMSERKIFHKKMTKYKRLIEKINFNMKPKPIDLLLLRCKLYIYSILLNMNEMNHVKEKNRSNIILLSTTPSTEKLHSLLNLFIKQIGIVEFEKENSTSSLITTAYTICQ